MSEMFYGAINLTGNFSGRDASKVSNMSRMFYGATNFNQPLNSWNTSGVTNMGYMFANATSFNQPLNNWNTRNVNNMIGMFQNATSFEQDVGDRNVTNVTNMQTIFSNTNISVYNYNEILDKRSKQAVKGSTLSSSLKYGGCELNAQYGIDGRIRLQSKGRNISDGGKAACVLEGTLYYKPEAGIPTGGPVTAVLRLNIP
jgi:surface protein